MGARRIVRRSALALGVLLLASICAAAGWAGYVQASGNVHTVIAGQLYRSAELSEKGFERVIARAYPDRDQFPRGESRAELVRA